MDNFKELTGLDEGTPEGIAVIQHAARIINASEELGNWFENENYHSLQDTLLEAAQGLHVHTWDGEKSYYDGGSYEVECSVPGCWNAKYYESED
jgi:hypothetical protein